MAEKQEKRLKNSPYNQRRQAIMGRVIALLVVFLMVLPMISATDFDNWKFYDTSTKTITIKNAFGLGATIAEITLLDNTYYCLTTCTADFRLDLKTEDYKNPISSFDFYKYLNKKQAETSLTYKTLLRSGSYEVDVDDYSESCKEKKLENGTIEKDCSKVKSGSHKETRYNYVEYNGADLASGVYYFRIEGKKGARDDVEWVPTFLNNQRIIEWAPWNSSYNMGLQSYHLFDSNATYLVDSVNNSYNLTDYSSNRIRIYNAGKSGSAITNANSTIAGDRLKFNYDFWNIINQTGNNSGTFAVSYWINQIGNCANESNELGGINTSSTLGRGWNTNNYSTYFDIRWMCSSGAGTDQRINFLWGNMLGVNGDTPDWVLNTVVGNSTINLTKNTWYHVYLEINRSTINMWINNLRAISTTFDGSTTSNKRVFYGNNDSFLFQGAVAANTNIFMSNMSVDEISIWNRTLSNGERTDLYSNGDGTFYSNITSVPNINITYPLNATYTTNVSALNYTVNGTGIQACWYSLNNGATNTTITCGQNATGLTSNLGSNTWRVYANNTQGIGSAVVSFNITPYTNAVESFNNITTEGNTEIFVLNLTLSSGFTISVPRLIYNNTLYAGTVENIAGNNYSLKRILAIPNVGAKTNYTFYWSILFSEGSIYNTTTNNQTVLNLSIDDCSSYQAIVVNYTLRDEETQAIINSSYYNTTIELDLQIYPVNSNNIIVNFSKSYPNTSQVCLESLTNLSEYRLYSQAKYYADLYVKRNHYLQNFTLKNTTIPQNINLFDLKTAKATQFLVTFKDSSFLAVAEALININKKYVSEGVFKTVEIEKTDDFGQAMAYFDLANALYSIVVTKEGRILATFDNIAVFCEDIVAGLCKINLDASAATSDAVDFNTYNNLQYGERFNSTTRIYTMSFNTYDNSAQTISINLTKFDMYGNSTICSNSVYTSSGTLACTVPQSYNNLTFSSTIYINNQPASTSYYVIQPLATETFSGSLVIFTVGLILTLGVMMIPNVIGTLIGAMVGLGIAVTLFLISGTVLGTSFILLVVIVAIIIWRIRQGGSD